MADGAEDCCDDDDSGDDDCDDDDDDDDDDANRRTNERNARLVSKGLQMLRSITTSTNARHLRPTRGPTRRQMSWWAGPPSDPMECIELVLNRIPLLASMEAQGGGAGRKHPFGFTSMEAMATIRSLLDLYDREVRVSVVGILAEKMRTSRSPSAVLLPHVLDMLRPAIVAADHNDHDSDGDDNGCKDGRSAAAALTILIVKVISPFLDDMQNHFDDGSPLPRSIPDFMFTSETYSSVASIVGHLRRHRWGSSSRTEEGPDDDNVDGEVRTFVDDATRKLESFLVKLDRLLDFWSCEQNREDDDDGRSKTAEAAAGTVNDDGVEDDDDDGTGPPSDWHRLFLVQFAIQGATHI